MNFPSSEFLQGNKGKKFYIFLSFKKLTRHQVIHELFPFYSLFISSRKQGVKQTWCNT